MNRFRVLPARTALAAAASLLAGGVVAAACAGGGASRTSIGVPAGPLPLKLAPRATESAITAGDLMTRLYIFADDSMLGRDAGTIGNLKGAAYIERELRRLGLQPAGENGTYFQNVPLVRRGFAPDAALSIDGQTLTLGSDFLPASGRGTLRPIDGAVDVIYGGTLGQSPALTREQAAGKLVLLAAAPGGVPRVQPDEPLGAAAGVAIVGLERLTPGQRAMAGAPMVAMSSNGSTVGPVPIRFYVSSAVAERMLGRALADAAVGTAGRRVQARLTVTEQPAPARNVVAILPGSDPALRGTYVALGAHNDHVGVSAVAVDHDSLKAFNAARRAAFTALDTDGDEVLTAEQQATYRQQVAAIRVNVDSLHRLRPARRDSVFNGADDDGSGSMALLEIAEQLASAPSKPRRSVLFVWHTGEEKGLLGSRWYTDHPTVVRDSIVAQINIDMIGRGTRGDIATGGADYVGAVGARRLSTELGDLTEAVNRAQRAPLRLDYALDANGHPENIYCRSDHYNYARFGIPIVFFFTGLHGDYHQLTDEPQYIDYPHYARITNYVRDLAERVANLDHRPVVDKPKPDPTGSCRQ